MGATALPHHVPGCLARSTAGLVLGFALGPRTDWLAACVLCVVPQLLHEAEKRLKMAQRKDYYKVAITIHVFC